MTLTRKQITEGLDTVPVDQILGKAARELTPKQKRFALEIAKGSTKADAYRAAYKPDASRATLSGEPYRVAIHPGVSAEIEAYQRAIEAARYRTPAALRELVIQSLVSVVINPETKDSVKVAAAKVLGTVTEVAAFTERKEVRTISSSEDAKAKIMGELKRLIKDSADDATIIDADSLLAELAPHDAESADASTHPPATPRAVANDPPPTMHTIPHEQNPVFSDPPPPQNLSQDVSQGSSSGTPPVNGTDEESRT